MSGWLNWQRERSLRPRPAGAGAPRPGRALALLVQLSLAGFITARAGGQVESVEPGAQRPIWVDHARAEGHLALKYSPAGAFSPDSSLLAVVSDGKIALMDLRAGEVRKVLNPRIENIVDLHIESANFVGANRLFVLATGFIQVKGRGALPRSPLLGFQWDFLRDALEGKVYDPEKNGEYSWPRWFPRIGYLGLYKESSFLLWQPTSGRSGRLSVPQLTHPPHLFELSLDGRWILLAQIETNSAADPAVVDLNQQRFADVLQGHRGTVLGMAFSHDNRKVATACEDGKVRVWSVPEWKLLLTLAGHYGPVHWAEFSPDAKWLASAGEDRTARIWSVDDGQLVHTFDQPGAPVLTASFSPDGEYLAASTEQTVSVWKRQQ